MTCECLRSPACQADILGQWPSRAESDMQPTSATNVTGSVNTATTQRIFDITTHLPRLSYSFHLHEPDCNTS